jgi:hypothetical protein
MSPSSALMRVARPVAAGGSQRGCVPSLLGRGLAFQAALGGRLGMQTTAADLYATRPTQAIAPPLDSGQRGLHQANTMDMTIQSSQFQVCQQIGHGLVTPVVDAASQFQVPPLLTAFQFGGHLSAQIGMFLAKPQP